MKKIQIVLAVITGLIVLASCLGLFGYYGVKVMKQTQQRMSARAAFDAKDWKKAEKLLKAYVSEDFNSEEDFVRLALVYRHLGNVEEEMRCWGRASDLNPLKPEYRDDYIACALSARAFRHLQTTLSHKLSLNVELSPKEKLLYLISAVITMREKDAEQFYSVVLEEDPLFFQKDDLGRFAEFLVTYRQLDPDERKSFIESGIESDDPFVRQETILFSLADLEWTGGDAETFLEKKEALLKQVVDMNRFIGIPLLADFYFGVLKFGTVIELAEPYLADIDDVPLSIIYAESCVYGSRPEKLLPLIEHYRALGRTHRTQCSYFEALYDFTQGEEKNDELAARMREVGSAAQTDLANLINLQLSLNSDNVENIRNFLEVIMRNPPFYDMQDRARASARHYLGTRIEADPALAKDPMMARIAQLISTPEVKDPFLMRLIIADLSRRNLLSEQTIQENLADYPYDPYLLQVAAEFELFNGRPDLCLEYTERYFSLNLEKRSSNCDLLHMLAQELSGNIEEATKEYTALVDNSEMDRGILYRYFRFCIQHGRAKELDKMAERLEASSLQDLKGLAPYFRAEVLFSRKQTEEALALLESAGTECPDFVFHAANMFTAHDKLDQALSRYLLLVGTYPDQRLVLANMAEAYLAKEMKAEALSSAERAWEEEPDDQFAQFIYAKMLAANGRYQAAERVLRIPYRRIELSDAIRELWTDIMIHCIQEDFENRLYLHALDRANHYLVLFPDDTMFQEYKARAEEEFRQEEAWRFLDDDWSVPSSTQDDADGDLSSAF